MRNLVMRKYLAATFLIAVAIGPASALDIRGGAKVGPVGVSTSVGLGKKGASAGIGADVDKVGGAKAGASAGKKGTSAGIGADVNGVGGAKAGAAIGSKGISAGFGANVNGVGGAKAGASLGTNGGSSAGVAGNVGRANGGVSAGAGSTGGLSSVGGASAARGNASGGWAAGTSGRGSATTIIRFAPATSARPIVLPRILWPLKAKRAQHERGEWGYPLRFPLSLAAIPGTPPAVVRVCRRAIASAASPLGALQVRAASAGSLLRHRSGALTAPLAVSIDYRGQHGVEVRQARIRCRLDPSGRVTAVIAP
ncbi:hypothetical protein USDA257_c00870 [Sinorhizobium fredii USDA 257]|uniref:Helicase n=2 Tax=Rhizobium fredii TaxID=380 RepID=I3WYI3_SINF2|nr:hypothetical protein USDA257_c00870 [Sinorhizobium fredii USDA 257]